MSKVPNLVGTTIGRLHVEELLRREPVTYRPERTEPVWKCKCECGNVVEKRHSYLINKSIAVASCGCTNGTYKPGFKVGTLTILKKLRRQFYLLKCEICNRESKLSKTKLKMLPQDRCPCDGLRQHYDKTPELLLNKKIGNLFVKRLGGKTENSGRLWECLCDCGKTVLVASTRLLNHRNPSCGCGRWRAMQYEDLSGKTFQFESHKFTVVRRLGSHTAGGCLWLCRSSCGHEFRETTGRIKSGTRRSCGMCISRPWLASEEVVLRELAGKTTLEHIGKRLNRTASAVRQKCYAMGLSTDVRKRHVNERRAKIDSLVSQGFNVNEIAEMLGVCKSLVRYYRNLTKTIVAKELARTRQILKKSELLEKAG